MKYCPKCQRVYDDSREKCSCGRAMKQYGELRPDTPVCLVAASGFERDRIAGALEDAGIPFSERPVPGDITPQICFGKAGVGMELSVVYEDYERAKELLAGIGCLSEELMEEDVPKALEKAPQKDEREFEEMSKGKRWFWRVISMILFAVVVWGVVSGTDWVMNLIRGKL